MTPSLAGLIVESLVDAIESGGGLMRGQRSAAARRGGWPQSHRRSAGLPRQRSSVSGCAGVLADAQPVIRAKDSFRVRHQLGLYDHRAEHRNADAVVLDLTARFSARPTTPYFATLYAPRPTLGIRPANDAVKATWPPVPCSSNRAGTPRRHGSSPTGRCRSPSASPRASSARSARDHDAGIAEDDVDLAEKTKRLIGEVNHLVEIPDVAHRRRALRSPRRAGAPRPVPARGLSTSASTTRAPRLANSVAVANPMPFAPPVITDALPSNPFMARRYPTASVGWATSGSCRRRPVA